MQKGEENELIIWKFSNPFSNTVSDNINQWLQ